MPKQVLPLTDTRIRGAKAKDKPFKLADGGGLYLLVQPNGSKLWCMKYRQSNGKENKLHFGAYPHVSLAQARQQRDDARNVLAAGRDPGRVKADQSRLARIADENTFEKVAREWHEVMLEKWQPQTAEDILNRFERDIFPEFGDVPISEVEVSHVLRAIRSVEDRGALEIAKRLTQNCSRVFKFAKRCGYTKINPAEDLHEVLKPRQQGHFAAIDTDDLPAFLRAFHRNQACMALPTRVAMHLMMLVFVRTSELIETTWEEMNEAVLETGEWIIPWRRMKRGRRRIKPDQTDHFVYLPHQARALVRELHELTGRGKFLFPNQRDSNRPMSNNALLKALDRMGYKGDMTGHGFRTLAMSTLKERLGYRHEVVDRQLAHAQKDKLESAYDRAKYMEERKEMLQRWADYIDQVAAETMLQPSPR
jgi:integrase